MFEKAVSGLGGEAARLYPEVIKLGVVEAWALLWLVCLGLVFGLGSIPLLRHAARRDSVGSFIFGLFLSIVGSISVVSFGPVTYHLIRVVYAPEAAFVMDQLSRLIGGK